MKIRHGNIRDCKTLIMVRLCYCVQKGLNNHSTCWSTFTGLIFFISARVNRGVTSTCDSLGNLKTRQTFPLEQKKKKQESVCFKVGRPLSATLLDYNLCPKQNKAGKRKLHPEPLRWHTARTNWHGLVPSLYILWYIFHFSQLLFIIIGWNETCEICDIVGRVCNY